MSTYDWKAERSRMSSISDRIRVSEAKVKELEAHLDIIRNVVTRNNHGNAIIPSDVLSK